MNTELQVKVAGTALSGQIPLPNPVNEIYISLYANTLASKAGLRAGVAYINGNKSDLVACDLLEVSSMLLKTKSYIQIDDANNLQQFSDLIQRNMLDFAQTKASGEPIGSNSLQMELAQCKDIALQECRFILGQSGNADESFFELSELARTVISKGEPRSLRSIWTHLLAARTFLLKAVELFAEVLQDVKNNGEFGQGDSYQKFRAFAPLIWVANSFYDVVPEKEINSLESLDKYLDAMRFQFPVLDCESTEKDEHCIELLEQCLSEARVAGLRALQTAQVTVNC